MKFQVTLIMACLDGVMRKLPEALNQAVSDPNQASQAGFSGNNT
jgi:hypothetical protein